MKYNWDGGCQPDGEFRVKLFHYGNHVKLAVFKPGDSNPVCTINISEPPVSRLRLEVDTGT